jgi:polysaccharide export outer membrane protein
MGTATGRYRFSFFCTLLALVALVAVVGCTRTGPYVWASNVPAPAQGASRIVRPGDKLQVVVAGQDTMSGEVEVRPGGELILPVAGRFRAVGLTPEALAQELTKRLEGVVVRPIVTVVLVSRKPPSVTVLGEVRTPGRFEMRDGEGVLEALARAGGLTPFADEDSVFVLRRHQQNPRVRFRYSDLAAAVPSSIGFELIDGDVVVAE